MVVVVDYGMGNLRSILYKLSKFKLEAIASSSPADIRRADKLILPGVGHFAKGMENLRKFGLLEILNERVLGDKIPILGICLGVQLFTKHSEEGDVAGLGWVDAATRRFSFPEGMQQLRIPHIGWNTVKLRRPSRFWPEFPPEKRFYFVHSYHISCSDPRDVVGVSDYGCEFVSILEKGNIFGTQFHPEKSHRDGFAVLSHFVRS
ncbi:MAG: imidazole glycerol phosphate synthase, glutamine amidotransferase subunit [Lentisphaerae bacterium GWF2_52_8]|nr:MAG: imidazole glycerol phosphate synthase, glutamine amidotransferase subunit [Lentisphaerae bacterium GWF2_52_8]